MDEVYAGWHGAPNIAESRVPIIASFLGDTTFIDDAMAKTFGKDEARLSEVAHFVEELFERAGRGKRK